MINLIKVLDDFVLKLKGSQSLSKLRFVHGGRGESSERPLVDFLVACSATKEEFTRSSDDGEEYKGTLEFTLYAPQGEGKRALTLLAENLSRELKEADTAKRLGKITVADSTFDSNLTVWKQVVSALYVSASERVTTPQEEYFEAVCIGDQRYTKVTSFDVEEEYSAYERRELLAGGVEEYVAPKKKYLVKITVCDGNVFLGFAFDKSVNIYRECTDMTYDDCRLLKTQTKTNGIRNLTFVCRRARKGAEVNI